MNKGERLPFIQLQNKTAKINSSSSISNRKYKDQNEKIRENKDKLSKSENNGMIIDDCLSFKLDQQRMDVSNDLNDKKLGDAEYYKCIANALKSAIDENEDLREKIKSLLRENRQIKDDIEDKNSALKELAQFYEYCQNHHFEKDADSVETKSTNKKRRGNSL